MEGRDFGQSVRKTGGRRKILSPCCTKRRARNVKVRLPTAGLLHAPTGVDGYEPSSSVNWKLALPPLTVLTWINMIPTTRYCMV